MMCKNKNDLIEYLLYSYIEEMSYNQRYVDYIDVGMDCIDNNKYVITLDSAYSKIQFSCEKEYIKYLRKYRRRCNSFIRKIERNVPKNVKFEKYYDNEYEVDINGKICKYPMCCILEYEF